MRQKPSFLNKSSFYFLVTLVIVIFTVAYGIMQYQVMMKMKFAIENNETNIAELEAGVEQSEKEYRAVAEDFKVLQAEFLKKMKSILPDEAGYTDLARLFDNYFASLNRPGDEIEQNNLVFAQPQALPDMNHISVLPISMNLKGSRNNFQKFLKFVEESGTLESGQRLMEIKQINFNFEDGGEVVKNLKQNVTFSVRMNTYFRTPLVPKS